VGNPASLKRIGEGLTKNRRKGYPGGKNIRKLLPTPSVSTVNYIKQKPVSFPINGRG